ncbi:unnamed protein product [Soboliphyme baturini]|uniref:Site-specific DNA-methyltransferase (adenine-specific) n=1 Tax=Soboliphyme baturini TaxID=241478 RepID=A0A183J0E1_9BILA|nr:unnamed protein product [Soboliphyme baturini]
MSSQKRILGSPLANKRRAASNPGAFEKLVKETVYAAMAIPDGDGEIAVPKSIRKKANNHEERWNDAWNGTTTDSLRQWSVSIRSSTHICGRIDTSDT